MNFLADSMLGNLARWLRMLGQDVIYDTQLNDSRLLEMARKNRVLLTKDLELYKRAIAKGIDAFYVESEAESNMLADLAHRYSLTLIMNMEKSNCPMCNTKLKTTTKDKLSGKLEKNTLTYYKKFWNCPNCGKIYWQGAHWKQINNTLNEAQTKLEKLKENKKLC